MVNRRRIPETHGQRIEVLNEGKVRKRRHQRADRCHRDDEKERRKDIATQFATLKTFLPKAKKNRTRQEILSCTRELIWELWRNEEILSLASVNEVESKIAELEKLVVMKRDKKRQLESIKRTAAENIVIQCGNESEETEVSEVVDVTSSHVIECEQPAEIVTDEIINRNIGYVVEEVLPPELYDQLVNNQLNQNSSTEDLVSYEDIKIDPDDSMSDSMSEAVKIVGDTFKVEEINHDDQDTCVCDDNVGEVPSVDSSTEVNGCQENGRASNLESDGCDVGDATKKNSCNVRNTSPTCEELENLLDNNQSQGSRTLETNSANMSTDGDNDNSFDYSFNDTRTSEDGSFSKFPHSMPSFNPYFMPFQLWPPFIQPDQAIVGYQGGFPMPGMPNPSCAYSSMPAQLSSPPPRSSLDMLACPDLGGQVVMNDCLVSESSGNVDVVN